jgi:hypothetical protein
MALSITEGKGLGVLTCFGELECGGDETMSLGLCYPWRHGYSREAALSALPYDGFIPIGMLEARAPAWTSTPFS